MSDENETTEEDWEDEGGAGVREPRRPKSPSDSDGATAEPEPELVAAWYY